MQNHFSVICGEYFKVKMMMYVGNVGDLHVFLCCTNHYIVMILPLVSHSLNRKFMGRIENRI